MAKISWLFKFSLVNIIPKTLNQSKQIHALLITTALKTPSILSKLIQHSCSFSPHQISKYALHIVDHEHDGKVFLFNTLIKCSQPKDSIFLFSNWVSNSSIVFDDHTFIFALGACARIPSVSTFYAGMQIHGRAVKSGFMSDVQVATTVIYFYGSNGCVKFARKVFDEMPLRSSVTWNALLTGYSSQKQNPNENAVNGLVLFKGMLRGGVKPNGTTMVCVLSAASQLGEFETGRCVHGYMVKALTAPHKDVYLGTGLLDMYSKCGCFRDAYEVFSTLKVKNVLTWTAMTAGLAFHGKGKEAIEFLSEMKRRKIMPNAITFTSVLSACCHSGLLEEGLHLFNIMEREFGVTPQIEHYGCIIDLLGRAGHLEEAYDLMIKMPIKPDPILWRSLLGSCRLHGDTEMGEKVGKILLRAQPNEHLGVITPPSQDYIALSNVYALAGRWQDVGSVRGEMKIKGVGINNPGHSALI